jgi:DNA-binding protein HU-beta
MGRKVRIDKLGILTCKERAARKGRNPQTGEEIKIPASQKISFRVAKSLKEKVGATQKTSLKKRSIA